MPTSLRPWWSLAVVVCAASARADVVIQDQTFVDANWMHSILYSMPTATVGPMMQVASGGNPGSFQQGHHHTLGGFASIWDGHVYVLGSYDPSTQGAVASLDVSYDYIDFTPGGTQNGLLVVQGGHNYIRDVDSSYWTAWTAHAVSGILASDTIWQDVSASGVTNGAPDFSAAGAPMQFGYYTFNWSLPQGFDIQRTWGIDNFTITLHTIAPPVVIFCSGDGSGTACPCGNSGASGEGCLNSFGTGGKLVASGVPSVATDTLVIAGSQMPNSTCLYFQGTSQQNGGAGTAFGDGLRCAGGQIVRLGTKTNANGASSYPQAGDATISVRGGDVAGDVRTYQCWYRNAASFCTSSTFNLTNGLQATWTP